MDEEMSLKQLNVWVRADLLRELEDVAAEQELKRSDVVRKILRDWQQDRRAECPEEVEFFNE